MQNITRGTETITASQRAQDIPKWDGRAGERWAYAARATFQGRFHLANKRVTHHLPPSAPFSPGCVQSSVIHKSATPSYGPTRHTIALWARAHCLLLQIRKLSPGLEQPAQGLAASQWVYARASDFWGFYPPSQLNPGLCLAGTDGKRGGTRTER